MRFLMLTAALVGLAAGQSLPTLPAINTVAAGGTTCTIAVTDAQMSVAAECIDDTGNILYRSSQSASLKGGLLGTGPVLCLYWTDGAPAPTVRLQCSTDDDTGSGPRLVLDGKLAPVQKRRQWWIFWR